MKVALFSPVLVIQAQAAGEKRGGGLWPSCSGYGICAETTESPKHHEI